MKEKSSGIKPEYRQAHYSVVYDGREVELCLGEPLPAALAKQSLALITAHNPGGRLIARTENARRQAHLEAAFEDHLHLRGEGRSPDASWRETSIAVIGIDLATATLAAERFGQDAFVFAPAGGSLRLVEVQ